MLDNFGLGEFFFLAMLALLFFGPERLPRIGASLGRWVSKLTQYSKVFLTEWREEALAIHEAVEEVRGIRDELAATRAELSSTLDVAREDMSEGLDAAKDAVSGARLDVVQRMTNQREEVMKDLDTMAKEEEGEKTESDSGEEVAISKTQQILDDLRKKREVAGAETGDDGADIESGNDGADEPQKGSPESVAGASEIGEATTTLLAQQDEPEVTTTTESSQEETEAEDTPERPKETAFDRTQKILDDLAKRRSEKDKTEPSVEPSEPASTASVQIGPVEALAGEGTETEESPEPPRESAFDRTQKILDDLVKRRSVKAKTETASTVKVTEPDDGQGDSLADEGTNEPKTDTPSIDPYEFERLGAQVDQLQAEIVALRGELRAIQTIAAQDVQAVAGEAAETSPNELPVEEAA